MKTNLNRPTENLKIHIVAFRKGWLHQKLCMIKKSTTSLLKKNKFKKISLIPRFNRKNWFRILNLKKCINSKILNIWKVIIISYWKVIKTCLRKDKFKSWFTIIALKHQQMPLKLKIRFYNSSIRKKSHQEVFHENKAIIHFYRKIGFYKVQIISRRFSINKAKINLVAPEAKYHQSWIWIILRSQIIRLVEA